MGKRLGFSWSWRRATGLSAAQGKLSRAIGIPLSYSGRRQKAYRVAGGCLGGCLGTIIKCVAALLLLCLIIGLLMPRSDKKAPAPWIPDHRRPADPSPSDAPPPVMDQTPIAEEQAAPLPSAEPKSEKKELSEYEKGLKRTAERQRARSKKTRTQQDIVADRLNRELDAAGKAIGAGGAASASSSTSSGICGATTASGGLCQNRVTGGGRCHLHQ